MNIKPMNKLSSVAKGLMIGGAALGLFSLGAQADKHMAEPKTTEKSSPSIAGHLRISDAWARMSFGRAVNSAGFMSIENKSSNDDELIGVSSTISKITELHTHIREGDIMKMRRVEGGIKLPKGAKVELKPGGLHVMFIGLKEPLKAGVTFPITLKFKSAGDMTISITAQKMAKSKGVDHSTMDHGMMDHSKMNHK